jgi:hypothetical protein
MILSDGAPDETHAIYEEWGRSGMSRATNGWLYGSTLTPEQIERLL